MIFVNSAKQLQKIWNVKKKLFQFLNRLYSNLLGRWKNLNGANWWQVSSKSTWAGKKGKTLQVTAHRQSLSTVENGKWEKWLPTTSLTGSSRFFQITSIRWLAWKESSLVSHVLSLGKTLHCNRFLIQSNHCLMALGINKRNKCQASTS